jgi:dihydropyrimidine dehydrogenase (NAD+) subunit PreT
LALYGHCVEIFDAQPKSGGLNEYGIASYKTVDNFAQAEVDYILSIGGIDVKHNQRLGVDITLDQLKADYDAVFVGIGLSAVNTLGIEGHELEGVMDAVEVIAELRQSDDLEALDVAQRTVVIGGGMTAIDAAVQTKMLGSDEVTLAYRRGEDRMNASQFEQDLAKVNGVVIRTWLQPLRVLGEQGKVSGVEFARMSIDTGKYEATGETLTIACEKVLSAIGQVFDGADGVNHIELHQGRIKVDDERRTSDEKVWAGGDCIEGGEDLTVSAVQDGKLAAESIHTALQGKANG